MLECINPLPLNKIDVYFAEEKKISAQRLDFATKWDYVYCRICEKISLQLNVSLAKSLIVYAFVQTAALITSSVPALNHFYSRKLMSDSYSCFESRVDRIRALFS